MYGVFLAVTLIACVLAAQSGLLALVFVAAVCIAAAILVKPDVATLLVVFAIYSNAPAVALHYHGIPFLAAAAVPLLLLVPIGYYVLLRREQILAPPVLWLISGFVLIQIAGSFMSSRPEVAVRLAVTDSLLEGLLLFVIVLNAVRSPQNLRRVVWVLLLVGSLLGSLGLYQRVTKTYGNHYAGFAQINRDVAERMERDPSYQPSQPRQAGPIGEENRHAHLMLLLVPLGFFQYRSEPRPWLKLAAIAATALIAVGIALTQSRGALVAFVVMTLAMVFMRYIRWKHAAAIALASALIIAMFPSYRERVVSIANIGGLFSSEVQATAVAADRNIMGRANEAVTAMLVFLDHPILGVGNSMFKHHYEEYRDAAGFRQHAGPREAHNFYLGLAAEHGILGLALMLAILLTTMRRLARARRQWLTSDPQRADLAAAFLLVFVAYMAVGMFAGFAYVRYFWLMLALATVAGLDDHPPGGAATGVQQEPRSGSQLREEG